MLRGLTELTNYRADEPETAPTNERLSQFYAFLERSDYSRFFVWVDFDNPELRWSFVRKIIKTTGTALDFFNLSQS